jgi:protoporphyrinogen/coproporphyrinogen III oxidase
LLGGVYAGRCEDLSFAATLSPLAQAACGRSSLTEAAASLMPVAPGTAAPSADAGPEPDRPEPAPVFTTLSGGLGTLPPALAGASGADVRTSAMVREMVRRPAGWRLIVGSAHAPDLVDADAVIIAVPATPASRLLAGIADSAAAGLAEIRSASMAIVTLAYPVAAFPQPLTGSGFLVPPVDNRAVKAVTFSTVKWPHLRGPEPDLHLVRCSLGRLGEQAVLQRDDSELAALAAADLADAVGVRGAPVDVRVSRWGGGLPQYSVGHLDRVATIRAGIQAQPGLAICGAAYDGVGIPACIATARLAVDQVLAYLGSQDLSA